MNKKIKFIMPYGSSYLCRHALNTVHSVFKAPRGYLFRLTSVSGTIYITTEVSTSRVQRNKVVMFEGEI